MAMESGGRPSLPTGYGELLLKFEAGRLVRVLATTTAKDPGELRRIRGSLGEGSVD
jgi:hypothetical protein